MTSGTVLVIEDDPLVLATVIEIIESMGFAAMAADNGDTAIAILQDTAAIDIMLTDVMMQGISGTVLARQALRLRPALHVVLMSGYSEDMLELPPHCHFLSKPFSPGHLEALFSRLVDNLT